MEVGCSPDLTAEQRKSILNLLDQYLPNTTVWAFGSRSNWTSHAKSDLDLVAFTDKKRKHPIALLQEAFEESNLPFRVDLLIWDELSDAFKAEIKAQYVVFKRKKYKSEEGWMSMPFSKAVQLNPPVKLERGECYQYVDMAAVSPQYPDVSARTSRKYFGSGSRFQDGDVLMARITPCLENGKIAYFKSDKLKSNASVGYGSTEFIVIRGRPGITDTRFAYYLTQWESVRSYAVDQMTGTSGRQRVPIECFDHKNVVIPPIPEQHRITKILGTFDDKIEKNRLMNETLEEMARALFKSWFIDFDPVRAKMEGKDTGLPKYIADLFPDRLVDSELGKIPEGWEMLPLDEMADFVNGLALQKFRPKHCEERLPVVKIAQLRSGKANSNEWADSNIPNKHIIDDGDIVFSWSGSLLLKVWCGKRAALNQHLFKVSSDQFPKWFVFHCIGHHLSEFRAIAAGKTTTMGHIQRHHLSAANCVIPNFRLIEAGDLLSSIFNASISLSIQSRKLVELRDFLLPKLISGSIRC